MTSATLHGSAAVVAGHGVLIRGPSGSGKSSLVMQVLAADPDNARLIADDQVVVEARDGRVVASAPAVLAGLIEIRGQGILRAPAVAEAPIDLVVDLVEIDRCPRMPTAAERQADICGVPLRRIFIVRGATDATARLRVALAWPMCEST